MLLFASVTPSITALAEVTSYNSVQDSNVTSADSSIISEENSNVTMSADEKEALIKDVMSRHTTVSEEFIREGLERQLVGDYTIPGSEGTAFRSAWQGITVDQMGALIDTAVGVALGAGVGGLAAAIKYQGKHAAKSALKSALIKYGLLGGVVSDAVLDFALNLTSPGYHVAKYWDQHDKVPNNGRINF